MTGCWNYWTFHSSSTDTRVWGLRVLLYTVCTVPGILHEKVRSHILDKLVNFPQLLTVTLNLRVCNRVINQLNKNPPQKSIPN